MRRRFVIANVALVAIVLLLLEVPLAITFARREHDASATAVASDATSLAALSHEVIEHPTQHDPQALATQFADRTGGAVVVIDSDGQVLATGAAQNDNGDAASATATPGARAALDSARIGRAARGRSGDDVYSAVPVGTADDLRGAVLVIRSDDRTETRIDQFRIALVVLAFVVLLVAALVGDRLSRWAIAPLRRLDDRAGAFGRGDLSARADLGTGPPEITELARTFDDMAERLEMLVGAQRQFVADASHQLRSPLTALQLRIENIDLEDPDAAAGDIDAALDETARLSRLIDGLLALARAERTPTTMVEVDAREALEARRAAWAALADERQVTIEVAAAPRLLVVVGDGHLEQILDNLIDNAIEASGGAGHVTLAAEQHGDRVEIHVRDNGRGMSSSERAHAFEPFWQGSGGHATGVAGLGLSIVDRLARANGGRVRLDDNEPTGVDVVVTLPARD
ncbi:MAG TPA: HAMP domain-containing sensor histidine kinase [Acidimicrobiales bacterium]|nr:HAMP domain-containing sensor histidine kinase [Acidimicrobiales bacterium]